jgi:hypothetical protein
VNVVTTVTGEKNDGPGLILLKPGVTAAQLGKLASSLGPETPLDAVDPYGTLVFDGYAAQGTPSTAQTILTPGN